MKTNLLCKIFSIIHAVIFSRPSLSRLRLATAGTLFLAAAGLAATAAMHPPKLPWAVPTVEISDQPYSVVQGVAVDQATNTIYVTSVVAGDQIEDSTIAVIDGRRCSATNASRCTALARMTHVGPAPIWLTFDPATRTLYVTNGLTPDYDENNTITVLNTQTCNAQNTSGCGQMPAATITVPGPLLNNDTGDLGIMALDSTTHTLYVGDAHFGPVSMINTATCNATNTGGCNQVPTTGVDGDTITLDSASHSVYIINNDNSQISVVNNSTCNSTNQSGCSQATTFATPYYPFIAAVDPASHTLYVPMLTGENTLGFVGLFDVSACNGTVRSGCGAAPPYLVTAGSFNFQVLIDPTSRTAYIMNSGSASISALNIATCNAQNHSGCPQTAPALAMGVSTNVNIEINPQTHTIYAPSADTNRAWVLDTHKCNAMHTQGCADFAPTTTVGVGPFGIANNPNTRTVYAANETDNTVSVIDATACNKDHLAGCNQTWPTTNVGNVPQFIGINKITNTIYVSNFVDNTLSVIDGATCNGQITSGCMQAHPTTLVGALPYQVAVDETTNTIYVGNSGDNTVSVINGDVCNGTDTSGCNQTWPIVTVGASPQALAVNPSNDTVYVANRSDNTVSVIDTLHCNAHDSSGCGQTPATIPVGDGPRSVGIVFATNTVFVGNRNDMTVSLFNGSTCNGTNTSGCPQTPPPAVLVGAFPDTGGNGNYVNGRTIAIDQQKQLIFVPIAGDSDVAVLDGHACRAGHADACHVKIAKKRAGGFPVTAAVDESTATVYVVNDADGTVSIFPSSR